MVYLVSNLPIVVLISGNGSNLQAIIDNIKIKHLPVEIKAVISDKPDAYGLERAKKAGIKTEVLSEGTLAVPLNREAYCCVLAFLIDMYNPKLIVLAGFMKILTPEFISHYRGRILNIHPSLLPKHKGLNTHKRVLEAGDCSHGASVHFVTEILDGGPVILQSSVPVLPKDTEDVLSKRVLKQEHKIYSQVLKWIAQDRVSMVGDKVKIDDLILSRPLIYDKFVSSDSTFIDEFKLTMYDYSLRGKCRPESEKLVEADPSLTLVRGWYDCPIWGKQPHWWCKTPDGEIVDPTKGQFPSSLGTYIEYKGLLPCEYCGKPIKEEDACFVDHHVYCSSTCYGRDVM